MASEIFQESTWLLCVYVVCNSKEFGHQFSEEYLVNNRHNIIRTAMLRHLNNMKFPSDASECLHVHIARSDSPKPRKKQLSFLLLSAGSLINFTHLASSFPMNTLHLGVSNSFHKLI